MEPKSYIYAELIVTDEEVFYNEYMPAVRPILAEHGARFLIAGGSPRVIEGDRDVRRIVLLEFDDPAAAENFYYSPEYQAIIDIRFRSASSHLYLIDGAGEVDGRAETGVR